MYAFLFFYVYFLQQNGLFRTILQQDFFCLNGVFCQYIFFYNIFLMDSECYIASIGHNVAQPVPYGKFQFFDNLHLN